MELLGKIALITGGASGIGLQYAKELLRNGVKAVTLADINDELGQTALKEIEKEFGPNRSLFVKTDVTNIDQFENAFKRTVNTFKYVDILINNAGILNEKTWEREIAIHVNGVIHGVLLGLENYLQKYKQGNEAIIVNIASIGPLAALAAAPIYCGSKAAVIALTRAWGKSEHYNRTKVKLLAICPGLTVTPMVAEVKGRYLGEAYENIAEVTASELVLQQPEDFAKEAVKLIQSFPNGTVWIIEGIKPAYQYIFPERETMAQ